MHLDDLVQSTFKRSKSIKQPSNEKRRSQKRSEINDENSLSPVRKSKNS